MSYIPATLRKQVTQAARHRCGYCLRSEELMGMPMTIEHLLPEFLGGQTVEENLWLSCIRCNQFKGSQTHATNPLTGGTVKLFNPRYQKWEEHFEWSTDGTMIIGQTECGRATVIALQMNNLEIVVARRLWVSVGWWPPQD